MKTSIHGPVIGAIVGDCLGAAYEFSEVCVPPFHILPSVFGHPAGAGTDDSEQTIIVADAILEHGYTKQALGQIKEGLITWFLQEPKDVGNTTHLALEALNGNTEPSPFVEISHGNGSLMRNSPIPTYWLFKKTKNQTGAHLIEFAQTVSEFTHPASEVVDACLAQTFSILGFIIDMDGWRYISRYATFAPDDGTAQHALRLAYIYRKRLQIGFQNYLSEIIKVGGDTDTNASISGAIAAAEVDVPEELVDQIDSKYLKYSLRNFA